MERITLTISARLLGEVDAVAEELGQTRGEFIRRAVSDLLLRTRQQQFEGSLAEGYRETARHSNAYVADALQLQAAASEGCWAWNE